MKTAPRWLVFVVSTAVLIACALPLRLPLAGDVTPTPTICPQATPELPPQVEPLPAQTDESAITIFVTGRYEHYIVTSEAGVVESDSGEIVIPLLPNTLHHFTVTGRVPVSERWGCTYGGYTLSSDTDTDGNPLVVQQGDG